MPEATQPGSDWPLPGKTLGFPSLAAHSCTFQKEWGIKTKSSGIVLKNRGSCALRKKVGRKARTVGGKRRAMGVFGDDAGLCIWTPGSRELACLGKVPVAITFGWRQGQAAVCHHFSFPSAAPSGIGKPTF